MISDKYQVVVTKIDGIFAKDSYTRIHFLEDYEDAIKFAINELDDCLNDLYYIIQS